MLGSDNKLFAIFEIDVVGEASLERLNKLFEETKANAMTASSGINLFGQKIDQAGNNASDAASSMDDMLGMGMNLLFAGMALTMVFGMVSMQMLSMTGAAQALGAGFKSALLPAFMAITPPILKFSQLLMSMPESIKMLFGALVILLTIMGPIMMVAGQAALFWGEFGAVVLGVAASIQAYVASAASAVASSYSWVIANSALLASLQGLVLRVYSAAAAALSYVAGAVSSAISATLAWVAANSALAATFTGILLAVGSLVLGIFLLTRVFKKFGPVVGFLATLLGAGLLAVLSPIAAVVLAIFGAFKAVNKIFKKFGKVAGMIAGIVVAAIGVLIAIFASVPIGIGVAIGAVLAIIWNFKDEIIGALQGVIDFFGGIAGWIWKHLKNAWNNIKEAGSKIVGILQNWKDKGMKKINGFIGGIVSTIKSLPDKIRNVAGKILSAAKKIGGSLVNGVKNAIKNSADALKNAFFNILPGPLSTAVKGVSNFAPDLVGKIRDVITPNDFILTSDGRMIQPDKRDTIVGFKDGGPIAENTGGGGTVNVEINDPVMKEDVDVERLVDEVEDRVNRNTRGRSGLGT